MGLAYVANMTTLTSSVRELTLSEINQAVDWLLEINKRRGVKVTFLYFGEHGGTYEPLFKKISVNIRYREYPYQQMLTLLHETIHAIQHTEGVLIAKEEGKEWNIPEVADGILLEGDWCKGLLTYWSYDKDDYPTEIPAFFIEYQKGFHWFKEWYEEHFWNPFWKEDLW